MKTAPTLPFSTDAQHWQAVVNRSSAADGAFVYSVKTTGVYCRPSCGARQPRRENVRFHGSPAEAERAGFRACKRCKPNAAFGSEHLAAVSRACQLMTESDETPSLETLARTVNLSPSHFHRVFKALTGVTPKAYATAQREQRVRSELTKGKTVTAALYNAGFNSNGRFYATSTKALGMKPKTFKTGGLNTTIRFAVGKCELGSILVAATERGICWIALGDTPNGLTRELQNQFPKAEFVAGNKEFERWVTQVVAFVDRPKLGLNLPLDIQGTAFQRRVWQKLSEIPCGQTRSYAEVAQELGDPNATRAVAGACAANTIAVAIPCHRVVRTDGSISGYRWGIERKARLLKTERGR